MELRPCGRSSLKLSALGVGCWAFGGGAYWGDCRQQDVDAVVRRSVEVGLNYFDTAEAYNDGRSEESLGQAVKGLPRDRLVIGTEENARAAAEPLASEIIAALNAATKPVLDSLGNSFDYYESFENNRTR